MKKYTNLILFGLVLMTTQISDISAGSSRRFSIWKKSDPTPIIQEAVRRWSVAETEPRFMNLLREAAKQHDSFILDCETNLAFCARAYPSNVIRAAKEVAVQIEGEDSAIYRILERMLSFK